LYSEVRIPLNGGTFAEELELDLLPISFLFHIFSLSWSLINPIYVELKLNPVSWKYLLEIYQSYNFCKYILIGET